MSVECDHPSSGYEQCYDSIRINGESWGAGDLHRCHRPDGHKGMHRHACTSGQYGKIVVKWENLRA